MRLVMKFGGTSLANGERIKNCANIVKEHVEDNEVVVIVSAMNGLTDELIKVTDFAVRGQIKKVEDFVQSLERMHIEAAKFACGNYANRVKENINKLCKELERVLTGVALIKEATPRSKDYILSFGERLSTWIFYGALKSINLEAVYLTGGDAGIVTDSNFGQASPLLQASYHLIRQRVTPLIESNKIPVITGFIAQDQDGTVTTMGRGGSDFTASIIGAGIDADEIWIWSDVDGLLTADPRIVSESKLIEELSYLEAFEMSVFGAKAMHPRALEPAMLARIPVRIRNSFNKNCKGTLITEKIRKDEKKLIKCIALVRNVGLVTITGGGMVGVPGTAAKVFQTLANKRINIMMISQNVSESDISVVISRDSISKAVSSLEDSLLSNGLIREVSFEDDVCTIAVVGAGLGKTPGIAAKMFNAIAREGINVEMISQGSTGNSISFVVKEKDGERAVRVIHKEFGLGG
jgi:aspartate kinase